LHFLNPPRGEFRAYSDEAVTKTGEWASAASGRNATHVYATYNEVQAVVH